MPTSLSFIEGRTGVHSSLDESPNHTHWPAVGRTGDPSHTPPKKKKTNILNKSPRYNPHSSSIPVARFYPDRKPPPVLTLKIITRLPSLFLQRHHAVCQGKHAKMWKICQDHTLILSENFLQPFYNQKRFYESEKIHQP